MDSTESVSCTYRSPDTLLYTVRISRPRLVVFSEIVYPPDWQAEIDGQPTSIIPANFVLRSVVVPPGEHTVRFICRSQIHEKAKVLSLAGSLAAWALLLGVGVFELWRRKRV
ncbi:MAG: YfhO family protein [Bacteroidia bacterium]|nr:YfhO family protein [Bacteroidia bacterium]